MKEDSLTGLYEREELFPYLENLINHNRQFTLALIDLNNFKKINDKYGHVFGDEVLKYVASTIKLTLANTGTLFRYGGDEFIVVFPDQDKKYAYILFKYCNRNLKRRPFLFGSKLLKITVSYGLAGYPLDAVEIKSIINIADKAMYCSKKIGKGIVSDISRIWILQLRFYIQRILLISGLFFIIFYIFTKAESFKFKKVIPEKKITEPKQDFSSYSCRVVLRNGFVLKGDLIAKDKDSLTLSTPMQGQEGQIKIDKSLIRKYTLYKIKKR